MKKMNINIVIVALSIGVIICLVIIAFTDLTAREATLLGVILTLFSIGASYLASYHFSTVSHKKALEEVKAQHLENLKTYALNAAEKVDNLSNELKRLHNYLEEEIDKEFEIEEEILISRTERIISSLHIVNTLKSMNDTSLSDWKGVIGEELEERTEEIIEREDKLYDLTNKIEKLMQKELTVEDVATSKEIEKLKHKLYLFSRNIDGVNIGVKRKSKKPQKEEITNKCPNCGSEIIYRQRPMPYSHKPVECQKCGNKSTARWYPDKGFVLEKNIEIIERFKCETCENEFEFGVPSLIYSVIFTNCQNCGTKFKIVRGFKRATIKRVPGQIDYHNSDILGTDFINRVKEVLPEQPWPKNVHKEVAEQLNSSNRKVFRAISELVRTGVFHPQVNGVIYYKKEEISSE